MVCILRPLPFQRMNINTFKACSVHRACVSLMCGVLP
uniref:Uncharacterized protein n=1 Tax=Physcomitrium patens TaxID=3218 RepID=A0A2K1IM96_PHYPA|nr:hypothetical protein PHYPA_026709 [Physcomitrium patens]